MGRSSDFKFWEEKLPVCQLSSGDEDHAGACSPTMWRRARVEFRPEGPGLLPQNHRYSCLSPKSRIRAIIDGQRELMEMIKDMPESSYELSLKDMVDEQSKEEDREEVAVAEEKIVKRKREDGIPWRGKSGKTKHICRSESMDSDVFLLKLFVPVSLSSKKKKEKAELRKHPRKCSGQTSERPEKQANKDWWKIIFLAIRDTHKNINIVRTSNISNRTSEKIHKSRGRRRWCLF